MFSDSTVYQIAFAVCFLTALTTYFLLYRLNKKINWICLIGLAFFVGLTVLWGQKIIKMSVIRGFLDGRLLEQKIITNKKTVISYNIKGNLAHSYFLCYQETLEVCLDVDWENWASSREGEKMTTIRVNGDDKVYHPSGIYANNDNFLIDSIFLGITLLAALLCLLKIIFPTFRLLKLFSRETTIKLFDEK